MATIAEQLIEKGKKKGIEEGIEEGIEKGIEKGISEAQRNILLRQLQHRFGSLPAGARERIEQAKRADLERWLDQVLTAATLAEVWGSGP